jgi:signal transduction histidine kinase
MELRSQPRSRVAINTEVVEDAVELVRPQLDGRGQELVLAMPEESPEMCCDATLLRIALVNLLDNASKYGNEGGRIWLTVEYTPEDWAHLPRLKVSVRNEGPGFSEAEKNKLFRRFSRLDDPALKTRRGTGVGLYNTWRIIQLHEGRIGAESRQGEWAEFSFEIAAAAECAYTPPDPERV